VTLPPHEPSNLRSAHFQRSSQEFPPPGRARRLALFKHKHHVGSLELEWPLPSALTSAFHAEAGESSSDRRARIAWTVCSWWAPLPDDSCATTGKGSGLEDVAEDSKDRDDGVSMATASGRTDPAPPFGMPALDGAAVGEYRLIEAPTPPGLTPSRCTMAARPAMASSCPCKKGSDAAKNTAVKDDREVA